MRAAILNCPIAGFVLCLLSLHPLARSQTLDVSAHVEVTRRQDHAASPPGSSGNVVVWLTSEQRLPLPPSSSRPQNYSLVQKNKQFIPHLLVVPTGSSVDFPNLDPFYHNVFSLFNGKRFDLGLYEAHTRRSVQFDREGVSYIFCNIHPEMGAVIISLSTPYYGVSTATGLVVIHGVPPGSYRINIWAENVAIDRLNALGRSVDITTENTALGSFRLETSGDVMNHHPNKFGESYTAVPKNPY